MRKITVIITVAMVVLLASFPQAAQAGKPRGAEPPCRLVRRGFTLKKSEDCSLRNMYRLVDGGDRGNLQAAAVALLHDNPRNLSRKNKYGFVSQIPKMSGSCVEVVRAELLEMIGHKQLLSKSLDNALALAATWDLVWEAIAATKSSQAFLKDLADLGFKPAARKFSKDYAAGTLRDLLQIDPTGAVSTAIRNLSKHAAGYVDSNLTYVTLANVESSGCYTRV